MAVPRGKVTGGSSAVNGEIFLRGIRADFDDELPAEVAVAFRGEAE